MQLSLSRNFVGSPSSDIQNGYMSFRPTPFQPLQFQPLQFQPFTLSTVHTFNRLPFRLLANSTAEKSNLFNYVQGYSILSRRSKTSELIENIF